MSYEPKPVDSQPPAYGAQSPPPTNQPIELQSTDRSHPAANQPYDGQYHQPQQMQHPQSPPPGQQGQKDGYMSQQQPQGYQQQHGYQQPQQQQAQGGGITMPIASLTQSPAPIQCPNCHTHTMTATTQVVGNTTHGWAAAICCCFCLGCIPYLMSSLKDVEHRCPKCGVHLATWHKSGRTDVKVHG